MQQCLATHRVPKANVRKSGVDPVENQARQRSRSVRRERTYRRTCSWSSRGAWRWRGCGPSSSPFAVCAANALSHCYLHRRRRRTSGRPRGRVAPSCSCRRKTEDFLSNRLFHRSGLLFREITDGPATARRGIREIKPFNVNRLLRSCNYCIIRQLPKVPCTQPRDRTWRVARQRIATEFCIKPGKLFARAV